MPLMPTFPIRIHTPYLYLHLSQLPSDILSARCNVRDPLVLVTILFHMDYRKDLAIPRLEPHSVSRVRHVSPGGRTLHYIGYLFDNRPVSHVP